MDMFFHASTSTSAATTAHARSGHSGRTYSITAGLAPAGAWVPPSPTVCCGARPKKYKGSKGSQAQAVAIFRGPMGE